MTHALVIAVFIAAFAADGIMPASDVARGWHLCWVAGVYLLILSVGSWRIGRSARRFAQTGRGRWIERAERASSMTRIAAVVWHAAALLGLGALGGWRALFEPLPYAGDAAALAQPLAVFVGTLAVFYPIERDLRASRVLRDAERGDPVRPVPSRLAYVLMVTRQQLGFIVLPLGCIYAWGLVVAWAWGRWALPGPGTLDALAQFAGAIGVFVLVPPAMRRLLDAVPVEPGALRESLVELGRSHRVRFREVLVWRTGGSQVNGAVMGLAAPLRYVMLTDGLLSSLPEREIEGVMAHEVAHVRRRHILWLGLTVVAAVTLVGTPLGWLGVFVGVWVGAGGIAEIAAMGITLAFALVALGFVSRRFEWQADAFAVKHLAGWRGSGSALVTPEAALAMISALHRVAALNGIDPGARGWRHGSIAVRTARLRALVGRRADSLSIDREAAVLKVVVAIAVVIGGALVGIEVAADLAGVVPGV